MAPTAAWTYPYLPGISFQPGTGAAQRGGNARGRAQSLSVVGDPVGSATSGARTGVNVKIPVNFVARGGVPQRELLAAVCTPFDRADRRVLEVLERLLSS